MGKNLQVIRLENGYIKTLKHLSRMRDSKSISQMKIKLKKLKLFKSYDNAILIAIN